MSIGKESSFQSGLQRHRDGIKKIGRRKDPPPEPGLFRSVSEEERDDLPTGARNVRREMGAVSTRRDSLADRPHDGVVEVIG